MDAAEAASPTQPQSNLLHLPTSPSLAPWMEPGMQRERVQGSALSILRAAMPMLVASGHRLTTRQLRMDACLTDLSEHAAGRSGQKKDEDAEDDAGWTLQRCQLRRQRRQDRRSSSEAAGGSSESHGNTEAATARRASRGTAILREQPPLNHQRSP